MSSKMVLWVVILTVFALSGLQIYGLWLGRKNSPRVLSASTQVSMEERVSELESRVKILERLFESK